MMRPIQICTALLALLFAMPADAQVNVRDHRKPKPPQVRVDGYAPVAGAVGATVTISGQGFTPDTQVLFGARRVKPTGVTPTALTITVPQAAGSANIVLRHPGVARDIVVGAFEIVAPPRVTTVAPASGVPGTRVEIRGTGFRPGDQVTMSNVALPIAELAPNRIVVTIPDGATTGHVTVARPGGGQSAARTRFTVLQPAPAIVSISPASGPPGTQVRITGQNLSPQHTVHFGRLPMAVTKHGRDYIDAVVPPRAARDDFFWVRGPNGEARSPDRFAIEHPPSIARFAPAFGAPGQQVEIFGQNFRPGDQILLGDKAVTIVQLRPRQISVQIPPRARSGAFTVQRGQHQASTKNSFEVLYGPEISGFAPASGPGGTQVTLTGTNLTRDARVSYGNQALRVIERRGNEALVVIIPPRAGDQRFTVRTRAGEAHSAAAFSVQVPPAITSFAPAGGKPGTEVVLQGTGFSRSMEVLLGDVVVPVVNRERRGGGIVVQIPATGPGAQFFTVRDGAMSARAARAFRVQPTAQITSTKPAGRVEAGSQLQIVGRNFDQNTRVFFGQAELPVVGRRGQTIMVSIPENLAGTDHVQVEDSGVRSPSPRRLEIVAPPPPPPPNVKVRDHRRGR